jgi:hypothetical protein
LLIFIGNWRGRGPVSVWSRFICRRAQIFSRGKKLGISPGVAKFVIPVIIDNSEIRIEGTVIKERNRRVSVEINCWLRGVDGASCVTTLDLSETGVSVASSDPLPEGRVISLQVYTPFAADSIVLKAEVVWSRTDPEGGMGLRFLEMNEKIRIILMETALLLRTHKMASQKMVAGHR